MHRKITWNTSELDIIKLCVSAHYNCNAIIFIDYFIKDQTLNTILQNFSIRQKYVQDLYEVISVQKLRIFIVKFDKNEFSSAL